MMFETTSLTQEQKKDAFQKFAKSFPPKRS